jgi:hypothetical protein
LAELLSRIFYDEDSHDESNYAEKKLEVINLAPRHFRMREIAFATLIIAT